MCCGILLEDVFEVFFEQLVAEELFFECDAFLVWEVCFWDDPDFFDVECDEAVVVEVGPFEVVSVVFVFIAGGFSDGGRFLCCFDLDGKEFVVGEFAPEVGAFSIHMVAFDALCFEEEGCVELSCSTGLYVVH